MSNRQFSNLFPARVLDMLCDRWKCLERYTKPTVGSAEIRSGSQNPAGGAAKEPAPAEGAAAAAAARATSGGKGSRHGRVPD